MLDKKKYPLASALTKNQQVVTIALGITQLLPGEQVFGLIAKILSDTLQDTNNRESLGETGTLPIWDKGMEIFSKALEEWLHYHRAKELTGLSVPAQPTTEKERRSPFTEPSSN